MLGRIVIAGVTTNRDFLVATLRSEQFLSGDTTTDFIERVDRGLYSNRTTSGSRPAVRAVALFAQAQNRHAAGALDFMVSGYRNSSMPAEQMSFRAAEDEVTVHYRPVREGRSR